jgi:hypothetical protein
VLNADPHIGIKKGGVPTMEIFKQKCPLCGATGEVRNNKGHAQFRGDIYLVDIEGHSVPCCKKCSAIMDEIK